MHQNILQNFNAFLDGVSYLGRVTGYTPPQITVTGTDYKGGGMDSPISIDMGMEPLEASITFGGFEPEAVKAVGKTSDTTIILRGALISDGGPVKRVVHTLTGPARAANLGEWTPGESATNQITIRPWYFRIELEGETILEIDVKNVKRIIDGVDQLEELRNAIGR